jgi:hypothetical protein
MRAAKARTPPAIQRLDAGLSISGLTAAVEPAGTKQGDPHVPARKTAHDPVAGTRA